MNEFLRRLLFLPEQASTFAAEIDQLHYVVIGSTMLGAFVVSAFVGVFLIWFRTRAYRGHDKAPVEDSARTRGGIPIWLEGSVIAGLLVLFLAFWLVGYRQFITLQTPPRGALDVYVTGKKWMWSFAYPDGAGSNAVLYVPVNRPVRLVLTSRDVIHSFYVPQFRIKQDAVPGRSTTVWFEANQVGAFDIFCTEYCGMGHSTMLGRVEVLAESKYERMLQDLPSTDVAELTYAEARPAAPTSERTSMAVMGERVAVAHGCLRCHTVDGTPHIGPTWAYAFGATVRLADGTTIQVDESYLTESMMDPLAKLHQGFEPVMPSYQGLLTAGEVGALVEYMRLLQYRPQQQPRAPLLPPGAPTVSSLPYQAPPVQPEVQPSAAETAEQNQVGPRRPTTPDPPLKPTQQEIPSGAAQ